MKKIITIGAILLILSLGLNAQTSNICVSADCKDTVRYPQDTITLNVTVSITSPDALKSILWTNKVGTSKIDNPSAASTVGRGLAAGGSKLYVYQVTGTSVNGAVGTAMDSVVYVPNQPPVALVGPPILDSTTTTVTLSGSNSTDPEKQPLTFLWTQVSGPNTATITSPTLSNPIVSNLVNGAYSFKLTVTDPGGLSSSVTQTVTVAIKPPTPVTVTKVITIVTFSDGSTKTTQAYP